MITQKCTNFIAYRENFILCQISNCAPENDMYGLNITSLEPATDIRRITVGDLTHRFSQHKYYTYTLQERQIITHKFLVYVTLTFSWMFSEMKYTIDHSISLETDINYPFIFSMFTFGKGTIKSFLYLVLWEWSRCFKQIQIALQIQKSYTMIHRISVYL